MLILAKQPNTFKIMVEQKNYQCYTQEDFNKDGAYALFLNTDPAVLRIQLRSRHMINVNLAQELLNVVRYLSYRRHLSLIQLKKPCLTFTVIQLEFGPAINPLIVESNDEDKK